MFHHDQPRRSRRRTIFILAALVLLGGGAAVVHGGLLGNDKEESADARRDENLFAEAEEMLARKDPSPHELYNLAVKIYGQCSDHGRGDPYVLKLVQSAASRGLPAAERCMGLFCRIGFAGTAPDRRQSRDWYQKAAEGGELDAMVLLREGRSASAGQKPNKARTEKAAPAPASTCSAAQPEPPVSKPAAAEPKPDPAPAAAPAATPRLKPLLRQAGPVAVKHIVRRGDSAPSIAAQYGISVEMLRRANPATELNQGAVLLIPDAEGRITDGSRPEPPDAADSPREPAAGPGSHTVKAGETLGGIARRYGVSLSELLQANGMTAAEASRIHVGQVIVIPD